VAGRILGSSLQEKLDNLLYEDPDLSCPITLVLFLEPVVASDGFVYEKAAIEGVIRTQGISPLTHKALAQELFPAEEERARARVFMKERGQALLRFAVQALEQKEAGMAASALDRVKDYVAALTPQGAPDLGRAVQDLYAQLGRSFPAHTAPDARINLVLGEQVRRANEDAAARPSLDSKSVAGTEKSVAFTVDVSGSMQGPRIQKARENLLKIFDEYIEDEDELAMITFDHRTQVHFELQEVGENRQTLRGKAEQACKVNGGTAFYDALIQTTQILEAEAKDSKKPKWIVSLTDGQDQHSRHSIDDALAKIRQSPGKPNLIVVGIQLTPSVKQIIQKLGTATEKSVFIDASGGLEALDDAFVKVAELICE
jgi:Mg-chelatase subunit ChlD